MYGLGFKVQRLQVRSKVSMYRAVRSYADMNYEVGLFRQELIAWCMLVPFI